MDSFNRISTTDTRLVRRIVRDNQFRGYTAQNTIATWDNVNKGEEKNIFPFQEEADSIFNTSLIYELGVLRNEAIPLLEKITKDEKEYAEAQRLIEILRYFEPISKDIVPSHSLLKERRHNLTLSLIILLPCALLSFTVQFCEPHAAFPSFIISFCLLRIISNLFL